MKLPIALSLLAFFLAFMSYEACKVAHQIESNYPTQQIKGK